MVSNSGYFFGQKDLSAFSYVAFFAKHVSISKNKVRSSSQDIMTGLPQSRKLVGQTSPDINSANKEICINNHHPRLHLSLPPHCFYPCFVSEYHPPSRKSHFRHFFESLVLIRIHFHRQKLYPFFRRPTQRHFSIISLPQGRETI